MRTLDPALQAALDNGAFEPYFNLQIMADDIVTYETQEILSFELSGIEAIVSYHDPDFIDDFTTFRIQRGVIIAGVPNYITTSEFWPVVDRRKNQIRTFAGNLFPTEYFSTPGDVTYAEIIDTICAQYNLTAVHQNPAAAWLSYQFLPTGRTLTLNTAKSFITMLRQKFLVFATDYGDGQIYFYHPTYTAPPLVERYTVQSDDISTPGHGANVEKSFISRDEINTVHTSGGTNKPIHNLGFLPSTASHPVRYTSIEVKEWIIKNIPPHLKYFDFDYINLVIDENTGLAIWPVQYKEVFNSNLSPAWQWQAKPLDIFGNTEGGTLPSTIEAAAPYTPLNTSGFDNFLNETVNNLQTLADWLDDNATNESMVATLITAAKSALYPIGSIYTSVISTNPATLLGFGTWTAFGAGRVLVGIDPTQTEFDTVEETGGAKTHTLTTGEMPSHTHTQDAHNHTQDPHTHTVPFNVAAGAVLRPNSNVGNNTTINSGSTTATNQSSTATNQNTGGGSPHNNLQPYIVVYMWKRTN